MYQVPPPLVIALDETWDKKVIHGHVRVYHPVSDSNKHFFSIKLCFRQRGIQPNIELSFGGQGRGLKILRNNSTKIMCLCSEK